MAVKNKSETNKTKNFILETLIGELGFVNKNIVTDITLDHFGIADPKYKNKKPDILISRKTQDNLFEFKDNLLFYCEAKDTSTNINDKDWVDAIKQGIIKATALDLPFFGVTNFKTTLVYNTYVATSLETQTQSNWDTARLSVNGNVINYFPDQQELEEMHKAFLKNSSPFDTNLKINQSQQLFAESALKKILGELNEVYRDMVFDDSNKIDFTIGLITLKMAEEKYKNAELNQKINGGISRLYISKWWKDLDTKTIKTSLDGYINQLKGAIEFQDFADSIENVQNIVNQSANNDNKIIEIYNIINKIGNLHDAKFDIFGTIYEEYATESEKKKFGEYFTRRNYTNVLCRLLFANTHTFDPAHKITVLDPTCGTGGFLTESFRVLKSKYVATKTYTPEAENYLRRHCLFGTDIRPENVARTKLNMFMVGDGHSNIKRCDSLNYDDFLRQFEGKDKFDFIVANPPYGGGGEMPLVRKSANGSSQTNLLPLTDVINTDRKELIFLFRIIDLLKKNGTACVVIPDGILENDMLAVAREELLKQAEFKAVISLPTHAFAPYTLEKTFAIVIKKRPEPVLDLQDVKDEKTWMYVIDHDGYANSNKRFPTRHKGKDGKWLHDELSTWFDSTGKEQKSVLEERYFTNYSDPSLTKQIGIDGKSVNVRKGAVLTMKDIIHSCKISGSKAVANNSFLLIPEFYLRKSNIRNKHDISNGTHKLSDVFEFKRQRAKRHINGIEMNTNLTEDMIYRLIEKKIDDENVKSCPVFSGATEKDGVVGEIPVPDFDYSNLMLTNQKFEFTFINNEGGETITNSNIHIESDKQQKTPQTLFEECLKTQNGTITVDDITYVINNTGVITIVADGKAGYMFHRKPEDYPVFAMNISCIVGVPKLKLDLKAFIDTYNEPFVNIEQGSGVRHFTREKINKIKVNI